MHRSGLCVATNVVSCLPAKARGSTVPPQVDAALREAADPVFAFDDLQGAAKAHLQASLSARHLADRLAFYRARRFARVSAPVDGAGSPGDGNTQPERWPHSVAAILAAGHGCGETGHPHGGPMSTGATARLSRTLN